MKIDSLNTESFNIELNVFKLEFKFYIRINRIICSNRQFDLQHLLNSYSQNSLSVLSRNIQMFFNNFSILPSVSYFKTDFYKKRFVKRHFTQSKWNFGDIRTDNDF
ncbi:hypothetical protein BpHYR1_032484 [Brachionus plicatilis]|uniref:Uncharacterized protein n=1 Tax=Brachionus plicatilis TaxID=10195 RepID=A0A3M7QKX0_BRAPC|nr:hypothetical protein BpHYR1_032484 [Brachionus plicatilis]